MADTTGSNPWGNYLQNVNNKSTKQKDLAALAAPAPIPTINDPANVYNVGPSTTPDQNAYLFQQQNQAGSQGAGQNSLGGTNSGDVGGFGTDQQNAAYNDPVGRLATYLQGVWGSNNFNATSPLFQQYAQIAPAFQYLWDYNAAPGSDAATNAGSGFINFLTSYFGNLSKPGGQVYGANDVRNIVSTLAGGGDNPLAKEFGNLTDMSKVDSMLKSIIQAMGYSGMSPNYLDTVLSSLYTQEQAYNGQTQGTNTANLGVNFLKHLTDTGWLHKYLGI